MSPSSGGGERRASSVAGGGGRRTRTFTSGERARGGRTEGACAWARAGGCDWACLPLLVTARLSPGLGSSSSFCTHAHCELIFTHLGHCDAPTGPPGGCASARRGEQELGQMQRPWRRETGCSDARQRPAQSSPYPRDKRSCQWKRASDNTHP